MPHVKEFTVQIDPEKYTDLVLISEEPRLSKLIDQGLAFLFLTLQYMAKGCRIAAVPVDEDGRQDFHRPITFLNF